MFLPVRFHRYDPSDGFHRFHPFHVYPCCSICLFFCSQCCSPARGTNTNSDTLNLNQTESCKQCYMKREHGFLLILASLALFAWASTLIGSAHEHYKMQGQGTGPLRPTGKDAEAVTHGHLLGNAFAAAFAVTAGIGALGLGASEFRKSF